MSSNVARTLPNAPRKNLAARLNGGESLHKPLVSEQEDTAKRLVGAVLDAALRGAGLTKQQASREMGYGDNQAPISNWIAGRENPQLSRLWNLGREFRAQFVIAW